MIRYAVVDTGPWFLGDTILISTASFGQPRWVDQVFPVQLDQEKVQESPEVDLKNPVSLEVEEDLIRHYGWPAYWGTMVGFEKKNPSDSPLPEPIRDISHVNDPKEDTSYLKSTKEVDGYNIQAEDGEIGHVEDFIVDDETWMVRYLVIDTRNWLPGGKKVLLAPEWVDKISWLDKEVRVPLMKDVLKDGPEFDPEAPVNREFEERLYDYYGRPKYWTS